MPTVETSGTISTTAGEQTIVSTILNRSFVLWLDLNAMGSGDTFRVRMKRKVLAGGTIRECAYQDFTGAQSPPVQAVVPVAFPYGGDFTIQRTAGSDRSVPWSLESL